MNQTEIAEAVKLIAELDGKRTQGEWLHVTPAASNGWSTVRLPSGYSVDEICTAFAPSRAKQDCAFIAAAPLMARTVAAQAEKIKQLEGAKQWQPIETAPKDGTEILCWVLGCDEHQVLWWSEHDCWKRWGDTYEHYSPTHWMPLPMQPNAAMKE